MDYIALFKRAFWITVRYRALWIFGFFLALCSATGGNSGGGGSNSGGSPSFPGGNGGDPGNWLPFDMPFAPDQMGWVIGGVIAGVACLILLAIVVGAVVRAVTRTALIGMVDQVEETETVTFKDGWRIGWSKRAWITFLIGLTISVPLVIIFGVLLLIAVLPLALILLENTPLMVVGIVATIGLIFLWILLIIAVSIIVIPLQELGWRYGVLQKMGAIDSLKAAYALIRQNLQDVGIVVLLVIGLGIAWALISIVLTIVVLLLALLIGGIPGVITYFISGTWWAAAIVGGFIFLIIMVIPLTFIQGLYLTFGSAVWTLAFRELTLKSTSVESAESAESVEPIEPAEPTEPTATNEPPDETDLT